MDTKLFGKQRAGWPIQIFDRSLVPGNLFIVDSGASGGGTTAGFGRTAEAAFTTLDSAIGNCTTNNGDVILILPGHAENITVADSIDLDVAGITIIGLGRGSATPTFSSTAAAGSITIDAANIAVQNIKLVSNFTNGTTAGLTLTANANFCKLSEITMRDTSATKEHLIHISVAAAVEGLHIDNCSLIGAAGSMTNSILFAGATTDTRIENTYIFVDSSDDVIDHLAAAAVDLHVFNCVVVNADADAAGYCLRAHASSTGIATRNLFAYNKVDAEISSGAAMWWIENYASNTIAESGLLDPTTAHAIP